MGTGREVGRGHQTSTSNLHTCSTCTHIRTCQHVLNRTPHGLTRTHTLSLSASAHPISKDQVSSDSYLQRAMHLQVRLSKRGGTEGRKPSLGRCCPLPLHLKNGKIAAECRGGREIPKERELKTGCPGSFALFSCPCHGRWNTKGRWLPGEAWGEDTLYTANEACATRKK